MYWRRLRLAAQDSLNASVHPPDGPGGQDPVRGGESQKGGYWRLLLLKLLPEPQRPGRSAQRISLEPQRCSLMVEMVEAEKE